MFSLQYDIKLWGILKNNPKNENKNGWISSNIWVNMINIYPIRWKIEGHIENTNKVMSRPQVAQNSSFSPPCTEPLYLFISA